METRPVELMNMFITDTLECSFPKKLSLSPVCSYFLKYIECSERKEA